ncbi:MAG: V-type ATP synthase subunit F [Fervidicoccaceae archaeon]
MSTDPMEGKVVVIGNADLVTMYRSIGCLGEVQRNPTEAIKLIEVYANRNDISLILVEKDLGEVISKEIDRIRRRTGKIIFLLPSPRSGFAPSNMRELVLKALGFG